MRDYTLCEGCGRKIGLNEEYHSGHECDLCPDCAPTFEDLATDPDHFIDNKTGEPMTAEQAQAAIASHVAGGGSITDKMVR